MLANYFLVGLIQNLWRIYLHADTLHGRTGTGSYRGASAIALAGERAAMNIDRGYTN